MKRIISVTLALLALAACDDGLLDTGDTWRDTDLPEAWEGDPIVTDYFWNCEPGSNQWTYWARTDGWASGIGLDIVETGDGNWSSNPSAVWDEYHELDDNIDYAEDGSWDEWEITLRGVSTTGSQVSGETTLFTCGYHSDDSLSWRFTMYDEGNTAVDCAVWGHRPIEAYGSNCYCFDC